MDATTPKDTIVTSKKLSESDTIVTSLIALRDELFARDLVDWDVIFKINSCLYATYPHARN
jgi:hypothetical protein